MLDVEPVVAAHGVEAPAAVTEAATEKEAEAAAV
jgi:hypothetical protein